MIVFKWSGDGIPKLNRATNELGKETKAHRAYRIAINEKGKKAFTQVKRNLSKQVGLSSQKKLITLGNVSTKSANFSDLSFTIQSSGTELSLKEFGAKQFSFGVKAKPWGKTKRFEGAFIFGGTYRSGKLVGGGHVFKNVGGPNKASGRNNSIEKMYGPSIPKEMVKDESKQAFESVARELRPEIEKTITKITDGIIR